MSYSMTTEKLFAYTIASVKDIGDVIKELMYKENFHLALEFLNEEKKAIKEALLILNKIENVKYQDTFTDIIPKKLKDIDLAIKFCNTQLVDGKYKLLSAKEEYKYLKRKQELKIKNLKKLKKIATDTNEIEFSNYLDKEIRKEEMKLYQA